jgi:hypothetical protein
MLEKSYEKELRRIASAKDAQGFGKWLSTKKESGQEEADRARLAAASEAARALVDYGASGEALARSGLADDGYADYLRRAAKAAREARVRAIEDERTSREREALSGYAKYLEDVRKAEGDRLVEAAEELLALKKNNVAKVDRIIKTATDDSRAAALLRHIRSSYEYIPSESAATDVPSVISRIRTMGYSADRAYRYCKLVGYSDERAREIASFATEDYKELSDELADLFGD